MQHLQFMSQYAISNACKIPVTFGTTFRVESPTWCICALLIGNCLFAAESRRQDRLAQRNKLKQDPALAAELAESRLQPVTYREARPTLAPAIQVSTFALFCPDLALLS